MSEPDLQGWSPTAAREYLYSAYHEVHSADDTTDPQDRHARTSMAGVLALCSIASSLIDVANALKPRTEV